MFDEIRKELDHLKAKHRLTSDQCWDPNDTKELLRFYARMLSRALEVERCSIFVHDQEKGKVWLQAAIDVGERAIEVPKEGSIVGQAITTRQPVIVTDLENKPGVHHEVDEKTGFVTREILCVPILSTDGKEVTGAIQALNKKNGKSFSADDTTDLLEMSRFLQLNIESIFLNQEAIGITERLLNTATRFVLWVGGGVAAVVLLLIVYLMVLSGSPMLAH